MKILIVSGHLNDIHHQYGGVVKSLPGFVDDLHKLHSDLSLLGISDDPLALSPTISSLASHIFCLRNDFKSRHSITIEFLKIYRVIRSHEMIILNGYHNFLLTVALIFVLILNKPFSIHFRGGLENSRLQFGNHIFKKLWNKLFLKYLLKNSKKIYCSTEKEMKDIYLVTGNLATTKSFIILPNRQEHLILRPKSNHAESKKHILYFGRISKQKGIFETLQAIKQNSEISLTCVGPIEKSDERKFLEFIKNVSNINYFPSMPIEKIAATLGNEVDAFISASSSENFGNVFVEASVMLLPIISSQVGVLSELTSGTDFIEIKGCRSPDDIERAINKFYSLKSEAKLSLASNAKSKLIKKC